MIEFFAGYGSQALALNELGVEFQYWRICEWAIKSIQAYKDNHFYDVERDYAKEFTLKECFRLMAVRDENFERIAKNQSNASLYHLAGDSIVVSVLVAILGQFVKDFDFNKYVESFYKQIKEQ